MFGEPALTIEKGNVQKLKIVRLGGSRVAQYFINISDDLKVIGFGESNITNKGAKILKKGIVLGEFRFNKPQ